VLIGRESECTRLDELLELARMGKSGSLAIRGEAGIGKTALLDYAAERAADMTVVRALGVESEAQLEFSGLLEVCWPMRDSLDELPEHQAGVLRSALGIGPAEEQDRFSLGAATLSLLGAAAEATPVCVLVDDAQWLDPASQEALVFAAKRLQADRAALLFAARDGEERPFDAPGVDSLRLTGLEPEAASGLIRRRDGVQVAADVADRLCAATRGNPLALIELPNLLTPEQLAGAVPLEDPLPAGPAVERTFARRVEDLPESSRTALLVAAVSTSSDLDTIVAGLGPLGLGTDALEPAEDAGLLRLTDGKLEFRHPLVRSAVYHAAAPSDRRAAHRAIADGLAGGARADVRAWHLAGAALGPDEEAAAALEHAAQNARGRGGYAAAAADLDRSARLTPDESTRLRRLHAAADASWRAGRAEQAAALATEALAGLGDPGQRGSALRLMGTIHYFGGRSGEAADALTEAVTLLEESDTEAAVEAAADAINALVRVRRHEQALETARHARGLAPEDGGAIDLMATIALGYAFCFAGRYADAEPHLRRAAELFDTAAAGSGPLQAGRVSAALGWLGAHEQAHSYLAETVARARSAGAVGALPHLLASASWQALHATRLNEAYADASEAAELAEELDQPVTAAQALGVLTWLHSIRGDEERCRSVGEETQRRAGEFGFRLYGLLVTLCFGLLDLGRGRVEEAIGQLERVSRHADERDLFIPGVSPQLELAEAYVRAGRSEEAEAVLGAFDGSDLRAVPQFRARAERCRGLLAEGDSFEPHFVTALELHAAGQSPFALARTRLCYGERLRRAGRRVDAREQLRAALDTFDRVGAQPWSERVSAELRASGETLRRREAHEAEELTPQELQIALQVAEGKTNKEVGAALFLSHKTIEFHLSRIYRKLDIHSRAELIRLYAGEPAVTSGAAG
jgi:DNA-binding CsgD family transcriptional regulator